MKNLFANRTVFWRSVVLGSTVSAMFLTGCASSSRGLFSRSVGKKDDQKIASKSSGRDPFLDANNDRNASATTPATTGAVAGRRSQIIDKRSSQRDVDSDRRSLSERFDRSRVTVTDAPATRQTVDPESPFSKLDRAPKNPFETTMRKRVSKPTTTAAPFPGGSTSPEIAAGDGESLIASASSSDARRPSQQRATTVRPATISHTIASPAAGGTRVATSTPRFQGSHPEIEIRPMQREPIEIQIIPRGTVPIHNQSEPADVKRNVDVKSAPDQPVVHISATRKINDVSGSEKVIEPEWRSIPVTVEKPFPANPFDAHAVATPKRLVAPPAPVDAAPAMPTVASANAPTAPLPLPASRVNPPRAVSAVSQSREADDAVANPAVEEAQGFTPPRWALYATVLFAAVVVILRRRRRTAMVR